jgi:pimeloyl-ACP methyl ester carboxylesterase
MQTETHRPAVESYLVRIDVGGLELDGQLEMPAEPRGIVLIAHGSRRTRHDEVVAEVLRADASVGTLVIHLLTPEDDDAGVDLSRLASRVVGICDSLRAGRRTRGLPLGLFGANTGAAAALIAAAQRPDDVAAVVCRGGRPDLAMDVLDRVRAPTLLMVGGDDANLVDTTRRAALAMTCVREVSVVGSAGQPFDDPAKRGDAPRLAAGWFARFFPSLDTRDEPRG